MPMTLPGWDSIGAAARWHRGFEIAGFVALALLLLFEVAAYVYGNRKDVLVANAEQAAARERSRKDEQANQQRNAEVAEAVRSAAEAKTQTNQLRQQGAPRVLSQVERTRINAFLVGKAPPVKNTPAFEIKASLIAPDARAYAEQIAAIFRGAGWNVWVDDAMFFGSNITGFWITVQNGQAVPPAASILQHALTAAGISVRLQSDQNQEITDPYAFQLSVGPK